MTVLAQTIGFIGAGRMATALAQGFLAAGLTSAERMLASDPLAAARDEFTRATGCRASDDNLKVAESSEVLVLAVKPQHASAVMTDLRGRLSSDDLVISIAAGLKLSTISEALGEGPRLVRVMPNTPCLIGMGASAYCLGNGAIESDGTLVASLLGSVGVAFAIDEKLIDAVTGLSGSGPAFVYVLIEALSDEGVRMGLPRDVATALATHTTRGAAAMIIDEQEHPAVHKDRVVSPGGTTAAGLAALEKGGFRAAVMAAVEAATRRSVELGTES